MTTPAPQAAIAETADATILDRVWPSRPRTATTVTLGGNGRLTPADVSESPDQPRRLVLDFPNVSSTARVADRRRRTAREAACGSRMNSREPLVTRVVMEVADGATYHVERAGTGRTRPRGDLRTAADRRRRSCWSPRRPAPRRSTAEPDIPLHAGDRQRGVDHAEGDRAARARPPIASARQGAAAPIAARHAAPAPSRPRRPPPAPPSRPRRRRPRPPQPPRAGSRPRRRHRRRPTRRRTSSRARPRSSTRGTRSTSTSRTPISARCCASSTRSAG